MQRFDDDDDFIYHKVEGSQGSRAYLAGPFNNTVVHGFNNLVKINMYSKQYRNCKKNKKHTHKKKSEIDTDEG